MKTVTVNGVEIDVKALIRKNTAWNLSRAKEIARQTVGNIEAVNKLIAAGLYTPGPHETYQFLYIKVERDRLPEFRRALGCPLKISEKSVQDARKRIVSVYLKPVAYPGVSLYFDARMPRGSKCKIVSNRTTSHQIVCGVDA